MQDKEVNCDWCKTRGVTLTGARQGGGGVTGARQGGLLTGARQGGWGCNCDWCKTRGVTVTGACCVV